MGEVIHRKAAADDIIKDINTTSINANAKGGKWKSLAAEHLDPLVALIAAVMARLTAAQEAARPLIAGQNVEDDKADKLLGRISDEIWNAVGRPAFDPALSILFPGGIAYYAEGADEEQPDMMELLADLLEAGIHPRLDGALARRAAGEIRAAAAAMRDAVTAGRRARVRAEMLGRMKTAVARAGQIDLADLKRLYKTEQFSEAEIHTVIPDRERRGSSKGPGSGTPPPA